MSAVTLRAGTLDLELRPSVGGAIARFDHVVEGSRTAILRECQTGIENALYSGNFPLVPFVNRIRGGRFTFRGKEVRLSPNMKGDPSPLHGQGWVSAWAVERQAESEAVLAYRHEAGEWPWAYEARQHFSLDPGGLSLRLDCSNSSDETMPCGLGQHPYFPCGQDTRIDTEVTHSWTIDEHVLPVDKVPATGRFDLADRLICGQGLDNGFGGWGGTALLSDPGWPFDVVVSSVQARFFQVYSPASGGFFVAEPVSHANAALNEPEEHWEELGLRVLEPGEAMTFEMRIDVRFK